MSTMFDKVLAYQFIKKLTTPFTQWPGYKLGIIDANGNFLIDKSKFTTQQANAMGYFDILILNIKKLLAKIPGGASRLGTIAATLFLLRTPVIRESLDTEEEIEREFFKVWEEVKSLYEEGAVAAVPVNASSNVGTDGLPTIAGIGPTNTYKGLPGVSIRAMKKYKTANKASESPMLATLQRKVKVTEGEEVGIKTTYDDGGPDYANKNKNLANKVNIGFTKFIKKAKAVKEDINADGVQVTASKKIGNKSTENVMVQNPIVKKNSKIEEDTTLEYHTELNPKIWEDDGVLKDTVKSKLIQIADAWIRFTKIPPLEVKDIVITGGNVNYNYTSHSDIDLHLVISRNSLNPNRDFVDEYLQDKKILWTLQHSDISIYGYPVELYAQDVSEIAHQDQGVYSIIQNKWLARPRVLGLNFQNDYHMQKKVQFYKDMIDKMIASDASDEKIDGLKDKFKKMRSDSISKNGEFALGNLIFKDLRNTGYIDKLNNFKQKRTDRSLSLE